MNKSKLKLLWHEASNHLCIADLSGDLPLITVIDDEYKGVNPYYTYPIIISDSSYGFIDLGEL